MVRGKMRAAAGVAVEQALDLGLRDEAFASSAPWLDGFDPARAQPTMQGVAAYHALKHGFDPWYGHERRQSLD